MPSDKQKFRERKTKKASIRRASSQDSGFLSSRGEGFEPPTFGL